MAAKSKLCDVTNKRVMMTKGLLACFNETGLSCVRAWQQTHKADCISFLTLSGIHLTTHRRPGPAGAASDK